MKNGRKSPERGICVPTRVNYVYSTSSNRLTGRRRSRSHHTALLVMEGEGPNTKIGSLKTTHSHIDHSCGKHASNALMTGGSCGARDTMICD